MTDTEPSTKSDDMVHVFVPNEVFVVGSVERPGGQSLWSSPEMHDPETNHPSYKMHEVARVFFCRSTGWLRKHMRPIKQRDGSMVLHTVSERFGIVNPPRNLQGAQTWRHYDIERFAHSLFEHGVIDGVHLACVISIVRAHVVMYGFLDNPLSRPSAQANTFMSQEEGDRG